MDESFFQHNVLPVHPAQFADPDPGKQPEAHEREEPVCLVGAGVVQQRLRFSDRKDLGRFKFDSRLRDEAEGILSDDLLFLGPAEKYVEVPDIVSEVEGLPVFRVEPLPAVRGKDGLDRPFGDLLPPKEFQRTGSRRL